MLRSIATKQARNDVK